MQQQPQKRGKWEGNHVILSLQASRNPIEFADTKRLAVVDSEQQISFVPCPVGFWGPKFYTLFGALGYILLVHHLHCWVGVGWLGYGRIVGVEVIRIFIVVRQSWTLNRYLDYKEYLGWMRGYYQSKDCWPPSNPLTHLVRLVVYVCCTHTTSNKGRLLVDA